MTIREYFEDVRSECGLTRAQLLGLLGAQTERDLSEDAEATENALADIRALYTLYVQNTMRSIEWEMQKPAFLDNDVPYLNTMQAARALGVGEFHLANLRDREKLNGTKFGRRSYYTENDLKEFVTSSASSGRSSLANAFIRFVELTRDPRPAAVLV